MYGPTAAAATFARRLVKEKDAGRPLEPVIEKMNELIKDYFEKSSPVYCAKKGFVDEVISFPEMRKYIVAFTEAAYQNPKSICPHNHMLTPRLIMQRAREINVRLAPLQG